MVTPRGAEHTFTSHGKEVKFLMLIAPAGFEHYFRELSVPAEFMGPCPNPLPADVARLQATAKKYGAVFTQSK